jgi:hypothetical protein
VLIGFQTKNSNKNKLGGIKMTADEIIKNTIFSEKECSLIYHKIILLFELSTPDDNAFNIFDDRIQNHCIKNDFKILPLAKIEDVEQFYQNNNNQIKDYPSGLFVFSHSGKNQLRQLIRHMRNAFSHAGVTFIKHGGEEYFEIKALSQDRKKIKFFGFIPRKKFDELWTVLISTLKFKP